MIIHKTTKVCKLPISIEFPERLNSIPFEILFCLISRCDEVAKSFDYYEIDKSEKSLSPLCSYSTLYSSILRRTIIWKLSVYVQMKIQRFYFISYICFVKSIFTHKTTIHYRTCMFFTIKHNVIYTAYKNHCTLHSSLCGNVFCLYVFSIRRLS